QGVVRTLVTAPATRLVGSGVAPVHEAYARGAAQGYRDTESAGDAGPGGPGSGGAGPAAPSSAAPGWAVSLEPRQRTTQAGLIAAQARREGDRPASGGAPDLKDRS